MYVGSIPAVTSTCQRMITAVPKSLLALLALNSLWVTGCMPVHAAFLQLGVTFPDGEPPGLTILDVPLSKLHTKSGDLDPQHIAVYHTGRDPLPHRLLDKDGDGRPDHLRVKFLPHSDETWLVFVSPGAPNPNALPDGGHQARVTYHFRR